MSQPGKAGRAAAVRSRLRRAARRSLEQAALVANNARQRAISAGPADQQAYERMLALYDALRRAFAPRRVPPSRRPSPADIELVRTEALNSKVYRDFFRELSVDGDFEAATVATTRRIIEQSQISRARIFLQVFQRYEQLRPIAEVCLGLCAFAEPMHESAWTLFQRNDPELVLRWAAVEYFELAFAREPESAGKRLERVLRGGLALEADVNVWIEVAYHAFAAGRTDLAEQCLERAMAAVAAVSDAQRAMRLRARVANLHEWIERAGRCGRSVGIPADEVPFAVVGFGHPDRRSISENVADPLGSLAAVAHLLRHDGVTLTGDPRLVSAAERIRSGIAPGHRISGPARTVRLFEVDRDLSAYAEVPDGTWLIVSDWFAAPLANWRYDIPLDRRLRPLFVSFRIEPAQLLAPGAVEYLRAHGPVGCRDWETVFLLHAAGVPAFFSGVLESTLDLVAPPVDAAATPGTVFLDTAPDGPGESRNRPAPAMRERDLGENLAAAAEALRSYRDGGKRVVTADLRFHMAVRGLGRASEFQPEEPWDGAVTDYLGLTDDGFESMRRGLSDKLATVLATVVDGSSAEKVYETWRDACADDIAQAEAAMRSFPEAPELDFDIDAVCRAIRAESVTVERREPGPEGPEINVEFSLDENYTHQMEIVLDSVVEHATRPVRAFLCSRGLRQENVDRLVRLFPTVSFVWLRTDGIDYGEVSGKIKWASMVTMDRTMLPALLPDVDRIIHFDLDALCLADLAELFDVDMNGAPIAACDEPQPNYADGFNAFRTNAARLRKEGEAGLARELLIRTHAAHPFDFEYLNAGVMVLDLAKMRADDFCRRHVAYVPRFGINGQFVMNFYVGAARTKLDPDWNRLVRLEVVSAPKIAHWAGPFKPWAGHQYVADRDLWREQEKRFEQRIRAMSAVATGP